MPEKADQTLKKNHKGMKEKKTTQMADQEIN